MPLILLGGADGITLKFQENARESVFSMTQDVVLIEQLKRAVSTYGDVDSLHVDYFDSRPLMLSLRSPWDTTLDTYLKKCSLKYTRIRDAQGAIVYQFPKDARKKKTITSLRSFSHHGEQCIEVVPDVKFNYEEFLCSAVAYPTEKHRFRVQATASVVR